MSMFSFQLEVDIVLDLPIPSPEINAFCFHYVHIENCGCGKRQDDIGSPTQGVEWIDGLKCDFYAMAKVGDQAGEDGRLSSCEKVGPNHYKMTLTDTPIDTPTGPTTPEPYLKGGNYLLSSLEIATDRGTQLLLPPYEGISLSNVVVPDRTKSSPHAFKIKSLGITTKLHSTS